MPRYFTKKLFITSAVGVALTCHIAFAASTTEGTMVPENNAQSAVRAKPSRPYYLFLPDATHAFQESTERNPAWYSQYQGKQTSNFVNNNKETENSASLPTPSLLLSQEARPTTSLMIGWLPPKGGTNKPGPYQPDSYQYTSRETNADGCKTVDRTAGNAVETPDSGNKGLHLPAGWLLGMCLHY